MEWVSKKDVARELKRQCSEARLALLDGVLADVMHPIEEWPVNMIRKFLGPHLSFADRCSLFFFLTVNGFPPSLWQTWAEAQQGWLQNDNSVQTIISLFEDLLQGKYEGENGGQIKEAWCMELQRKVTVYTPNFAYDETGCPPDYISGKSLFTDAINGLKQYKMTRPRET